ncbi:MAG TPA: primosomal protein N' [Ignavibacteria bacterium]|nr:primosomal protein N' [Ignavibacteria bacterium]
MDSLYVNVALNLPIDSLFTYKVPGFLAGSAQCGKRVLVNFGKRALTGIITDIIPETSLKKVREIKTIIDDERIFSDELIQFCNWISSYYLAPAGEVLFSAVPRKINIQSDKYYFLTGIYKSKLDGLRSDDEGLIEIINLLEKHKTSGLTKKQIENRLKTGDTGRQLTLLEESGIISSENLYSKPTAEKIIRLVSKNFDSDELTSLIKSNKIKSIKQIQALNFLSDSGETDLNKFCKDISVSTSSVNSLFKKGLVKIRELRQNRDSEEIFSEDMKEISLNIDQLNALERINEGIDENIFRTYLLHGITGSGKTEVYINAIKSVLNKGKTAIVLVPEISLTPQLIHRFKIVFGNKTGVIHSKLSDGEKLDTYHRILNGTFRIIIGARSALFAPLKDIGIIIADEEHDTSYKQENSPKYNGRDAAIYRAKLNNAVIILGSATPSVESYYNAVSGKYELLSLPARVLNVNLPGIKIIDLLKRDKLEPDEDKRDFFDSIDKVRIRFISKELIFEIGERLSKKESIMILQNRRGYHSYLECLNCGNVEMCVRCNIALTYHKAFDLLKCHYCGFSRKFNKICTACSSSMVIPKGAGTERVEEELQKIFPTAVIKRLDSDTLTSKKVYQQILKDFYDRKIDILTGTQIISKGLDFPNVTLAGVVNADIGLLNPDFRATEKTFQILTQISGRSGRSVNKGEVLIQTNHSDFYVFNDVKNHDYSNFYNNEISIRKQLNYPPFSRLTIIETKSIDKLLAESKIKEIYNLVKNLDKSDRLDILPPNTPLFSKLKDKYRYHILIKSGKEKDVSGNYLNGILRQIKNHATQNIPKKVSVIIDVDAVNLL